MQGPKKFNTNKYTNKFFCLGLDPLLKILPRISYLSIPCRGASRAIVSIRPVSRIAYTTVTAARTAKSAKTRSKAQNIGAIVKDIERSGVTTLSGIARALEARGVLTPSGNANWQAAQVARVRAMAA